MLAADNPAIVLQATLGHLIRILSRKVFATEGVWWSIQCRLGTKYAETTMTRRGDL